MQRMRFSLNVAIFAGLVLVGRSHGQPQAKPDLYLLSVGIDAYVAPTPQLKGCVNDAKEMAKVLQNQQGLGFGRVDAVVLTDAQATRNGRARAAPACGQCGTSRTRGGCSGV